MLTANLQAFRSHYNEFLQDRKKIKAIQNISDIKGIPMHKKRIFDLILDCTKITFLDDHDRAFLGGLLTQLNIDYLDWCYKTPWLKKQIREMKQAAKAKRESRQLYFDLDKKDTRKIDIPVHILKKNGPTVRATA